jgi:hypothetical protein
VINVAGNPIAVHDVRIAPNKSTTVELEQHGEQISSRVRNP